MIKIDKIKPLGSKSYISITSIEQEYLQNIKKDTNPYSIIKESIATKKIGISGYYGNISSLNIDQLSVLEYLKKEFDNIIISSPISLKAHIANINEDVLGSFVKKAIGNKKVFKLNDFGKALLFIFGYENHFRTKAKKGIWLAEQLNIKSCPYCNSQYTLIVKSDSNAKKAKFQFDHYFSKKRYPYLSISLYNLIPSCASCNLSKSNDELGLKDYFHPYLFDLNKVSEFKLKFKPDISKLSCGDVSNLDLSVNFKSKYSNFVTLIENHNKLFDIESLYNRHSDIAEDLLYKAIINNSAFKSDMMGIKGLFNNDNTLFLRYLIGNYAFDDEINERPLSKYTQDIARHLDLIK